MTTEAQQEDYKTVSLTLEEWAMLKHKILRERPYSGRVSIRMAVTLDHWLGSRGPYFQVLDELDHLEELCPTSKTPLGTQFKRSPLFPFWHKHFTSAQYLIRNIGLRWGLHDGGNKEFYNLIEQLHAEHGHDPATFSKFVADKVVAGYFERARAGKAAEVIEVAPGEKRPRGLTGEWIIYGKYDGKNYYLDVATHKEAEENPQGLYERLRDQAGIEFPFLFSNDAPTS